MIKTILTSARVPIKIWAEASSIQSEAYDQLKNTADLPFVFKHVAVMPDVHVGKGATVGSVVATKGAIVPACVGVDIGCGMMAVKTAVPKQAVLDNLAKLRNSIERSVPVGFESNRRIEPSVRDWCAKVDWEKSPLIDKDLQRKAVSQLGSLGGGNHFIEVCLDTAGAVWVMLHSGSRNLGNVLAQRHIATAKKQMEKLAVQLVDRDLSYLTEGSEEFAAYLHDVELCQAFALQNRVEMMDRVLKDLSHATGNGGAPIKRLMEVNCHHNYVAKEEHFGERVLVTRKGAVRARAGDLGIIPGSMGTKSYIVRGLGNPESFESCSHGAGRRMSRGKAKEAFTVEDLRAQTAGVECRKDKGVLDEIPGAYKNIDQVMENQRDLVEVVAELKQVLCVKG